MKRNIAFLFVLFLIFGCNSYDRVDPEYTNIEIEEIQDSVSFDDVIEDYQYIPLSQENGFVIGEVDQVVINNDKVYVASNGVFCYDLKGNPIFKITNKGNAKSEYMKCTSISVQNGILYCYDNAKMTIHKYDSSTGKFIDNIDVPASMKDIYRIGDIFVLDNIGISSEFYEGDARMLTCEQFSTKPITEDLFDDQYKFLIKDQVSYNSESVLFLDYFNNDVYRIDEKGCFKKYSVDFPEELPENIKSSLIKERLLSTENNQYHYGLTCENDNFVAGQVVEGGAITFFYNKRTKSYMAFHGYVSKKYQWGPLTFNGVCGDFFYKIVNPESIAIANELLGFGDPLPKNHPDYQKQKVLLNNKLNDNPILVLYKIKDF